MRVSKHISIPDQEIEILATRSQGPGGQNVNKVSSAALLPFDIRSSSLPETYKQRLLSMGDRRINSRGVIVIRAQRYRSLEMNRLDALSRLQQLFILAGSGRKRRIPTKPSKSSQKRRLDKKTRHGRLKSLRQSLED